MQRRTLAGTDLEVSALGFGCSSWWAKSAFPEDSALALLHLAIEQGVNFFDTGSNYAGGQAERRLGKALRDHRRERIVVGTKAGTWVAPNGSFYRDFSPAAVRTGIETSLRNLGLEQVDLLHLHGPPAEQVTDDLLRCLEDLKRAGKVRHCGVNGFGPLLLARVVGSDVLSTMMFDFNVLRVDRKPVIERLVRAGKGFIAATPLAQAYFSNKLFKPKRMADLWYLARAIGKHRDMMRRGFSFRFLNDYSGWTGAQVALAYVLSNPLVSVAVFGTTDRGRFLENVQAASRSLPEEIISKIEAA
jgi:aryl-alcohol dehydrogenase-like predicted oxidoreductase